MNPATLFAAACIAAGIALARRLRYEFNPGDIEFMFPSKRPRRPPDHYFEARLAPTHREALITLLEGEKGITNSMRKEILSRVQAAIRYDLPYVEADWDRDEREMDKRGGLEEYLYDLGLGE